MDVVIATMQYPKLTKQPTIVGFFKRPRLDEVHSDSVGTGPSDLVANSEVVPMCSESIVLQDMNLNVYTGDLQASSYELQPPCNHAATEQTHMDALDFLATSEGNKALMVKERGY
jgi:hypothetical protein